MIFDHMLNEIRRTHIGIGMDLQAEIALVEGDADETAEYPLVWIVGYDGDDGSMMSGPMGVVRFVHPGGT